MFFSKLVVSVKRYLPSIIFLSISSAVKVVSIFFTFSGPSLFLIFTRVE